MSTAATPKLNRLQFSKSPYLLQHATNPVDWYEWGDEAFERARVKKKPVFLSVGYAACHWCHVLAHESFENEEIARYLNENFVNVKVDREERPDVDRVYMTFIQATVGRGGWPMSVFLTPSLHPFFGGTYFPPTQFLKLLNRITDLWATDSAEMQASGENIMSQLREITDARTAPVRDADQDVVLLSEKLVSSLEANFDSEQGGFGGAPKFPSPAQTLTPLLRHAYFSEDPLSKAEALNMSTTTLLAIDAGGIHDHVGGGFARYSVDAEWHVPHFEKMLYDQAQLLTSALTAALLHPVDSPARLSLQTMSEDIINYLSTSLTSPEIPAFFSAEDADSLPDAASTVKTVKVEGAYYVWEWRELEEILGSEDVKLFARHYGAELSGNVDARHDVQGELLGKNVLARQHSVKDSAEHAGISVAQAESVLAACRAKLMAHREAHRPKPHLDDKVVTSWNGLALSALALAHTSLPASFGLKEKTLALATDAARFVREKLWNLESQELRRSWREGPGPRGMSDDYAYLIQGLLDLYEATGSTEHLLFADRLQKRQNDLFHDPVDGGYFCSPADDPHLLVRMKDVQDGAEPSASGVTLANLLRLGAVFDDVREDYLKMAEGIVDGTGELLAKGGQAVGTTIASMWLLEKGFKQLILTGAASDPATQALRATLDSRFVPNRLLLHINPTNPPAELAARNEVVAAIIDGLAKEGGRASVRVCEAGVCGLPILSNLELVKELK